MTQKDYERLQAMRREIEEIAADYEGALDERVQPALDGLDEVLDGPQYLATTPTKSITVRAHSPMQAVAKVAQITNAPEFSVQVKKVQTT